MTNTDKTELEAKRTQIRGALKQIIREMLEASQTYHAYDGGSEFRTGELRGRIDAYETAAHALCDWTGLSYRLYLHIVENAMKKESK